QGVEAWGSGNQLVVRMRYGKAVLRRPEGDEADRLREDLLGDAAAYYGLVERFAELADGGTMPMDGRTVHRVLVGLAGHTRAPTAGEGPPPRPWRAHLTVDALSGTALVDSRTGVPLLLELKARYHFPKEGQPATATLTLRRELTSLGAVAEILAP